MLTRRFLVVPVIALLAALAISGVALHAGQASSDEHSRGGLVGSWEVNVTGPGAPASRDLVTFTSDGNVIASETVPVTTTPQGTERDTTGHGSWVRTESGKYVFVFVALHVDSQGRLAGSFEVRGYPKVDRSSESVSGTYTVTFYDPSGKVLGKEKGTFWGRQIEVEPYQ